MSIFVIAEIGINHNGDLDIAKDLINVAFDAGADAVKFQKRTIDLVYSRKCLIVLEKAHGELLKESKKRALNLEKKNMMR